MKNTGLTTAFVSAPVIETDDGDVLRPLRHILEQYELRAAYTKNFAAPVRPQPKNRKVIPAPVEPGLFYQQAAQAVAALIQ